MFRSVPKFVFGLLLALGIATGALASSAQPAQAAVVVSVGFGGGYAPAYHWHRWHDGYGWHRQWVPLGWAPPVAYAPRPVYFAPRPVVYGPPFVRPYFYGPHYRYVSHFYYGPRYGGWYGHARPVYYR